jgi:hypothetical protein
MTSTKGDAATVNVNQSNWHTIVSELVELRTQLDAIKPVQKRVKDLLAGVKVFMVTNETESIDGLGDGGRYSLELKDANPPPTFASLAASVVAAYMQTNARLPSDAELKAAIVAEQKRVVEVRKAELRRQPINAPGRRHVLKWKDAVAIEARRKKKLQEALVTAGYSADAVIVDAATRQPISPSHANNGGAERVSI